MTNPAKYTIQCDTCGALGYWSHHDDGGELAGWDWLFHKRHNAAAALAYQTKVASDRVVHAELAKIWGTC